MRESELSFIGHITEYALREVRVDKVVIGIPAVDIKMGLTNDYLPEVVTDRTIWI
jgi:DeoR family transcriptional regulator of aga operon/DeoR family fructose operon transcriptional repressor